MYAEGFCSGGEGLVGLDIGEHLSDLDVDGAADIATRAGTALRGAGGTRLRQEGPDLTGAPSAIGAASQAVIALAGRSRSAAIGRDGAAHLMARQHVARANDHDQTITK